MKILVTIRVPAISESFDVRIPSTLRIRSVTTLVAGTVETLSNHLYAASGSECLCSEEKQITLRNDATLKEYGIRNGDHLILI